MGVGGPVMTILLVHSFEWLEWKSRVSDGLHRQTAGGTPETHRQQSR